jgi:uncharacterized membrane protein YphA (DoxX/SURF4 family)
VNPTVKHIALVGLRWLLGGVFIFSGLVKCVDPVGTSVFVDKYLATYSLEALLPISLAIAVSLAVVEVTMGMLLVIGVLKRYVALAATIFLLLFTAVTLLSATLLPIGDCGCFGDAVKLTPWQTFLKNLVLLPMAVVVWRNSEVAKPKWRRVAIVMAVVVAIPLAINLYSLRYLPIVDFMPYKLGVDLRTAVANERELEGVRSILLFENTATGEVVEFPAEDASCWAYPNLEYLDARTESIVNEASKFADFRVYSRDGEDVTLAMLNKSGRVAWLCINDSNALTGLRLQYAERLLEAYPPQAVVVLTTSSTAYISKLLKSEVYTIDAMTLRSMMRADVGVVVINDGVIEFKADIRDI